MILEELYIVHISKLWVSLKEWHEKYILKFVIIVIITGYNIYSLIYLQQKQFLSALTIYNLFKTNNNNNNNNNNN